MATYITTNYTDKNNLLGGTAGTMEAVLVTNSRFDFGIKWASTDGTVAIPASPNHPSVGLLAKSTFPMNPDFGQEAYRNGFGWDTPGNYAVVSIDWAIGTAAGTIKELYYGCTYDGSGNPTARTLITSRDNVDPGWGAIGTGRGGQRYTFLLSGREFRVYNQREVYPVFAKASPTQGMGFPISLGAYVSGGNLNIEGITIGTTRPTTIYSARDQTADFGSTQANLHLRIYQNSPSAALPRGALLDVDV